MTIKETPDAALAESGEEVIVLAILIDKKVILWYYYTLFI
jgi:hypothetical protein